MRKSDNPESDGIVPEQYNRYALRRNRYQELNDIELAQSANRGRWLVSYADFMTLLMAFFVVMYSVSIVNEDQYRVLSDDIMEAFNSPAADVEHAVLEGVPDLSHSKTPIDLEGSAVEDNPGRDMNELPADFFQLKEAIAAKFENLNENEMVQVNGNERWLEIRLDSSILFSSGGADLAKESEALLQAIAEKLVEYDNVIRVEGFTDDVPVSGGRFASNWELSSARAAAVVKELASMGIQPERMAAVGYGEFQPIASNKTAEGRSKNRRIVVMVSTRKKLRMDAIPLNPEIVTEYSKREPLPDGQLVRGLEVNPREDALIWLERSMSRSTLSDLGPKQSIDTEALEDQKREVIDLEQLDDIGETL